MNRLAARTHRHPLFIPGLVVAALFLSCTDDSAGPGLSPHQPPPILRPASVSLSASSATLTALGDTVQLAAEVRDEAGRPIADARVTWTSSHDSRVTVNASGLARAVANGKAKITAAAGSVPAAAIMIKVSQVVHEISVLPATATLVSGGKLQLAAEVLDARGHAVAEPRPSWVSSDSAVATVDTSGLVSGVSSGTAMIEAVSGNASGRAALKVVTPLPSSIGVTPAAAALGAAGDTVRLTAQVVDQLGRSIEGGAISWSSDDESVATVDAEGRVRAAGPGFATITARTGNAVGISRIAVGNADRPALVAFYHATGGPDWANRDNWLTDAPLDRWEGVEVNPEGRVSKLLLEENHLTDSIPSALALLTSLEVLDLEANELGGPIPPELGTLHNLTSLTLRSNRLSDSIPPELGNLSNLRSLDLGRNDLTGSIPPEFGGLAHLDTLTLNGNFLTGTIPPQLANLTNLQALYLTFNYLTGDIPPELGGLTHLGLLGLGYNDLSGLIPPELGDLTNLEYLWLEQNRFTGTVPEELGRLAGLKLLGLRRNLLTGTLPRSLLSLTRLRRLSFQENAGLCAPGTSAFAARLEEIDTSGPYCNESDMDVLQTLFESTAGEDWINSEGWLRDAALGEWYGVGADSIGRVLTLDLSRNQLSGHVPSTLAELDRLTELRIDGNPLTGRLPLALARLSLREFRYGDTDLCVPRDDAFGAWLNGITVHEENESTCGSPDDRETLEVLYHATRGPRWVSQDYWLTRTRVISWHGVQGVIGIPGVVNLFLSANRLTGRLPQELGNLRELRSLGMAYNRLDGPIPPQLGNFQHLRYFNLRANDLTGPIPAELGNLPKLSQLHLSDNELTGSIPPELGRSSTLTELSLDNNRLTGAIPPELGNLADLELLELSHNRLEGAVPPEIGQLTHLVRLGLAGNPGLSGPLPSSLTALVRLDELSTDGTDLCAPPDPAFQAWLDAVTTESVPRCRE